MPSQESSVAVPKPILPPFWKWLMRVTFAVTMLLFFAPAVYVVKYYAVDRPREEKLAKRSVDGGGANTGDWLPYWERHARDASDPKRIIAAQAIGHILRQPGIGWRRPLECLSARATLSALAVTDPSATVRFAASTELGKVAQGGAVIRR